MIASPSLTPVQVRLRWRTPLQAVGYSIKNNIVELSSRLFLFSRRLIAAPVQEQSDAHWDEECHCIVHEHIDSVIVCLEQQDDEQVVKHDGNQHPCNPHTREVL